MLEIVQGIQSVYLFSQESSVMSKKESVNVFGHFWHLSKLSHKSWLTTFLALSQKKNYLYFVYLLMCPQKTCQNS